MAPQDRGRFTPVLVHNCVDHIALGRSEVVDKFSEDVGVRHLMGESDWQSEVLKGAYDGSTKFSVNLNGAEGIDTILTRGKYYGMGNSEARIGGQQASPFDWEVYILHKSGALDRTELHFIGVVKFSQSIRLARGCIEMGKIVPGPTVDDLPLPLLINRQFYVDSLVSTHKQLLLKSPMGDLYKDRVDVLFKGVAVIKLGFDLPELEVRYPTEREFAEVIGECGEETVGRGRPASRAYIISGIRPYGYVVAVAAFMVKNQEHGANSSQLLWDIHKTPPPSRIYRLV